MSALYHCLGRCFRQQTRNKSPDRKPSGISTMVCGNKKETPTKYHAVVANKIIYRLISDYTLLSITNKMQLYTIFFINVSALHVSGGFSPHHQELQNCTHSMGYMPSLLAATARGSSKQVWHIPFAACTVFELLMMGGETARNI